MKMLADVNPTAGLLEPRNHSCWGHKSQPKAHHPGTDTYLHQLQEKLWGSAAALRKTEDIIFRTGLMT